MKYIAYKVSLKIIWNSVLYYNPEASSPTSKLKPTLKYLFWMLQINDISSQKFSYGKFHSLTELRQSKWNMEINL